MKTERGVLVLTNRGGLRLITHEEVERRLSAVLAQPPPEPRAPWWRVLWAYLRGQRPCPCCGLVVPRKEIERRRLNTAYAEDASNWLTSCQGCFDDACAYYQERWDDLNADLMQGIIEGNRAER